MLPDINGGKGVFRLKALESFAGCTHLQALYMKTIKDDDWGEMQSFIYKNHR